MTMIFSSVTFFLMYTYCSKMAVSDRFKYFLRQLHSLFSCGSSFCCIGNHVMKCFGLVLVIKKLCCLLKLYHSIFGIVNINAESCFQYLVFTDWIVHNVFKTSVITIGMFYYFNLFHISITSFTNFIASSG